MEEVKLSRVHQKELCHWLPIIEGRFWRSSALNSVSRSFPASLKLKCSRVSKDDDISSRGHISSFVQLIRELEGELEGEQGGKGQEEKILEVDEKEGWGKKGCQRELD